MKKLFTAVLFLCVGQSLWSQITITKNDMPSIRDTVRYSLTNTNINVNATGPNMRWDFSNLIITGQAIDSFRSLLSINPLYILSFGLQDYGIRATNVLNTQLLQISNQYNFYKKTNSYLSIDGTGAEFNGIPLPSAYTIEDKVYQFPLTYARMDTTPYDVKITIPGFGSLHQVGTRYNNVDGWGKVITPYDSFDCIRLRAYTEEVDSITIDALGTSIGIPRNSLTYQWLANGQKIPVVEVSGTKQFNTFVPNRRRFRDNYRAVPPQFALTADFRANTTNCYTNAIVVITNRTRPTVQGTKYRYTITPSTFNFVGGTSDSSASPKVNFTAPGLYTVSLHVESPAGGSSPAVGDTTKVDYINVSFPAGIEDVATASTLEVYPNPVSDILTVRSAETINSVTLINSIGQKVMTRSADSKSLSISVKAYEEGTYLLDIETNAGHQIRKVVIQ
ncbi:MAG: hypothetical protein JWO03_3397 [Bacteroidetes bacterium]|nr:hypothetical protein [Bacteroidota bacterium]